jgi:hypothetical protein
MMHFISKLQHPTAAYTSPFCYYSPDPTLLLIPKSAAIPHRWSVRKPAATQNLQTTNTNNNNTHHHQEEESNRKKSQNTHTLSLSLSLSLRE